jgi:FkbM family methyltransferase
MKYNLVENQSPWLEDIYLKYFGYKTEGFFVELGVGHTFYQEWDAEGRGGRICGSNTGALADLGWKGILVEPHPYYYEECIRRHKDNDVEIINCAAGGEEKKCYLGLGDTLRPEVQYNFQRLGLLSEVQRRADYPGGVFEVEEKNILSLLEEHNCPTEYDLLSVDVEGYEKIIFKTLDLKAYRPKVVVVELRTEDNRFEEIFRKESQEVEDLITSQGYKKVYSDILNGVFVAQ